MTNEDTPGAAAMADYARLADVTFGVTQLARRIGELSHDRAELLRRGDTAAAAGATRLLAAAMLQLAAAPAADPIEYARKRWAIDAERLAASCLSAVGLAMVRAGLDADRVSLEMSRAGTDADRADLDLAAASEGEEAGPGPAELEHYANEARRSSFLAALAENEGLRHDHAYLVRSGEAAMGKRLAQRREFDLARTTSRPAATLEEARLKVAFIESVQVKRGPLPGMLAVAAGFERAEWGVGSVEGLRTSADQFPGAAERCAHYETLPSPTDAGAWIGIGERCYRDFDALLRRGDALRARGCMNVILDLGLLVAAIPARRRAQADQKLEFLAAVRWDAKHASRLAVGMLDAAIDFECAKW